MNWEMAKIESGKGESFIEYFHRDVSSSGNENSFNLQTLLALYKLKYIYIN